MSRLVAFGCSNTYGESLPETVPVKYWDSIENNYNKSKFEPSKYAWPNVLSNLLDIECVNLAVPGTSNKHIANLILNTKFESTDIVVIAWTYFSRTCIYNNKTHNRIMIQDIDNPGIFKEHRKKSNIYYKNFYHYENSKIDNYMQINLIKNHLDNLELNNYHYSWQTDEESHLFPFSDAPEWSKVKLHDLKKTAKSKGADKGSDNLHPGINTQQMIAEKIYNDIRHL